MSALVVTGGSRGIGQAIAVAVLEGKHLCHATVVVDTDALRPPSQQPTEVDSHTRSELGVAGSYYFARHPFKLQGDVFRLWDDDFGDGDTRMRVQLQLAF